MTNPPQRLQPHLALLYMHKLNTRIESFECAYKPTVSRLRFEASTRKTQIFIKHIRVCTCNVHIYIYIYIYTHETCAPKCPCTCVGTAAQVPTYPSSASHPRAGGGRSGRYRSGQGRPVGETAEVQQDLQEGDQ